MEAREAAGAGRFSSSTMGASSKSPGQRPGKTGVSETRAEGPSLKDMRKHITGLQPWNFYQSETQGVALGFWIMRLQRSRIFVLHPALFDNARELS